jgi:hypothetical protein
VDAWWSGRGLGNAGNQNREHPERIIRMRRRTAMITKYFIIAKDLCTYTIIILRQDKTLRDHGDELPTQRVCGD